MASKLLQLLQTVHNLQISRYILAKTNARIQNNIFLLYPGLTGNIYATLEKSPHTVNNITLVHLGIPIVHNHHRQIIFSSHLGHFSRLLCILQAPNIIQHMYPLLRRIGCSFSLKGINGHRHRTGWQYSLQEWLQPLNLFLGRHGNKAWTL